MSAIVVSIITMATIAMLVTRPGVASAIKGLAGFMSSSITALLGA